MEDGVSEVLSNVVEDVGQAVNRNITGAEILHELLSAPWLRSLLKIYECLLHFQRLTPSPFLPYATGLSHEIMTLMQKSLRPSAEARELYSLLNSPHIQALLSSHDSVAQSDYGPVLPPLPDELPEDEEAMRIVCLVKNNQPLRGGLRRGSVGDEVAMIRDRWSSLRRLTLERLVPARRARSGEEIRAAETESRPLPLPRGGLSRPFLSHYESPGSGCLCPQTAELWKKGLNQSAPSVFSLAPCNGSFSEKAKPSAEDDNSNGGSSDDYAYPPPPVPAYSLPNSPVLYKMGATGGKSRNIPTPGRNPSCPGMSSHQAAPCSPAAPQFTHQQGVSTMPTPGQQRECQTGSQNIFQEEPPTLCHNECKSQPKLTQKKQQHPKYNQHPQPDLTKQRSMEDLKSTVHMVTSCIDHSAEGVHHLGQKMVVATEMITESMEENTQALNLLAEVVDKLQGLIVANKYTESSPPHRLKQHSPPSLPPRVSSKFPKVDPKSPRPYSHLTSSSSSTSCSSTSSSASVSSCASPRSPKRMNGGSKRTVGSFSATQRAGGNNGQVRLSNGSVTKASLEDQQDYKRTGCLTTKKKKKNK